MPPVLVACPITMLSLWITSSCVSVKCMSCVALLSPMLVASLSVLIVTVLPVAFTNVVGNVRASVVIVMSCPLVSSDEEPPANWSELPVNWKPSVPATPTVPHVTTAPKNVVTPPASCIEKLSAANEPPNVVSSACVMSTSPSFVVAPTFPVTERSPLPVVSVRS